MNNGFLVFRTNNSFIHSIIRSLITRRAKTKTTSQELQPKRKDNDDKATEGIGDATYIKVKIMKAMKSSDPKEGRKYCRNLYKQVKNDHFGGNECEAGEQFNGIKIYKYFMLDATIITSNLKHY